MALSQSNITTNTPMRAAGSDLLSRSFDCCAFQSRDIGERVGLHTRRKRARVVLGGTGEFGRNSMRIPVTCSLFIARKSITLDHARGAKDCVRERKPCITRHQSRKWAPSVARS